MKITISGMPGSGKTTTAEIIAKKLGMGFYSIGKMQREIANKKGISLGDLSKLEEQSPEVDKEIDDFQKELAKKDNIIVDSRLGFYFIPNSLKIFLKVDLKEAARRVIKYERADEKFSSEEEAIKSLKKRMKSEDERYKKYYGIKDFRDEKNYDFVLDTTNIEKQEAVKKILEFINNQ